MQGFEDGKPTVEDLHGDEDSGVLITAVTYAVSHLCHRHQSRQPYPTYDQGVHRPPSRVGVPAPCRDHASIRRCGRMDRRCRGRGARWPRSRPESVRTFGLHGSRCIRRKTRRTPSESNTRSETGRRKKGPALVRALHLNEHLRRVLQLDGRTCATTPMPGRSASRPPKRLPRCGPLNYRAPSPLPPD